MRHTVPLTVNIMGFCDMCIRMRWLRIVTDEKIPSGICRQCARENEIES